MRKMLATLVLSLGVMGAAPSLALAHHHTSWGFGFSFGDPGFYGSYGYDGCGCGGYVAPVVVYTEPCGHWEYRTETFLVSNGYWQQVQTVDSCGCVSLVNQWVPPVYGTRTVRVWVP